MTTFNHLISLSHFLIHTFYFKADNYYYDYENQEIKAKNGSTSRILELDESEDEEDNEDDELDNPTESRCE